MPKTILITGATGKVSPDVIQSLQGSKSKLRVLVRDEAKGAPFKARGIEVLVGDFDRPRTLVPAFAGVDSVWLLTSPGARAPDQNSSAIWAARRAGVSHIVRMSAVGAAHNAPTINSRSHALSDTELSTSGIPFTILKPHFFMQNLMMSAQSVAREGAIFLPLGEASMGMIDSRDIGLFAAQVLTTGGHADKTYTLTGPVSLDMATVAKQLGDALGKAVAYVPVSVDQAIQGMAAMGLDDWMLASVSDYFTAYSNGWGDFVTEDFERVTGKAARVRQLRQRLRLGLRRQVTDSAGVIDNVDGKRFEMNVDDQIAFLEYRRLGNQLHLMHTEVPSVLRGRGVGSRFVRAVLDKARADGVVVIPHCPFVKAFLEKHPEYASLVRAPKSSRPTP